jgi:large subunit ribosomal protein L10
VRTIGRTLENKQEVVAGIKQLLDESQLAVVIDYQGLSVAEITDLRKRLRECGSVCKVTKNTLMRKAIEGNKDWEPMTKFLKGSSAFILVKDDIGGAIRAYQSFQKDSKKTEFRGGVMQGQALNQDQVKAIADLPSKEQLIAQIAGAINSVTAKLARSINEVPASLARGINEVPSSLGRAIHAVSDQKKDQAA